MIAQVLRLTRWEFFKVRKRWMPWILLGIVVIVTQISVWGSFSAYQSSRAPLAAEFSASFESSVTHPDGGLIELSVQCGDTLDQTVPQEVLSRLSDEDRARLDEEIGWELRRCAGLSVRESDRQEARERFVLPDSLANALGVAHYIGLLLVMILGASTVGVEYGWGTLRTALTRGTGRWQFLGAKALSLVLFSVAGLLVVSLTVVVSSLITASLTLGDGGGLAGAGQWSTAAVMFGKAVYGLVPYIVLALFMSVLTSSSSMGIATSLAYFFVEITIIQVLGRLAWFSNFSDFLLGPSIAGWMSETGVRSNTWIAEVGAFTRSSGLVKVSELPGQLHAFLVLTAYIAVLGGVALWLFYRKDIAGARGE